MNCRLCNKPLPSPAAAFGPHGAEVCAACYLALDDERAADFPKPSRCVACGKLAADEKEEFPEMKAKAVEQVLVQKSLF